MYIRLKSGMTIAAGRLPRDAVFKHVGEKRTSQCKFSIAAHDYQDEAGDKQTIWCNCTAWRSVADVAATFRKGDTVLIAGITKTDTWTGRDGQEHTTDECTVDFAAVMPNTAAEAALSQLGRPPAMVPPSIAPGEGVAVPFGDPFEEYNLDDELPF